MSHKSRSHRRRPLNKRAFTRRRRHGGPHMVNRSVDLRMFADDTRNMPALGMLFAAMRGWLRRKVIGI